jgi:hypothetical protein
MLKENKKQKFINVSTLQQPYTYIHIILLLKLRYLDREIQEAGISKIKYPISYYLFMMLSNKKNNLRERTGKNVDYVLYV